jgi:PEP-CTERM motif
MKSPIFILAGLLFCVANLHADTVIDSNFIVTPDSSFPPANYRFTVYQDQAGTDPTSILVELSGSTLTAITWNVDEEADYYLVPNLAVFTAATIASGQFPPLFVVDHAYSLNVGFGDFYLGINTGQGASGGHPNRNVFGWAHFVNDQTGLHMIGNAVTYGNAGIIVGTTTVIPVPEPSTLALAGIGTCLIAFAAVRKKGLSKTST